MKNNQGRGGGLNREGGLLEKGDLFESGEGRGGINRGFSVNVFTFINLPSSFVRIMVAEVKFDWPSLLTAAPMIACSVYFDKLPTVAFSTSPSNISTLVYPVSTSVILNT